MVFWLSIYTTQSITLLNGCHLGSSCQVASLFYTILCGIVHIAAADKGQMYNPALNSKERCQTAWITGHLDSWFQNDRLIVMVIIFQWFFLFGRL